MADEHFALDRTIGFSVADVRGRCVGRVETTMHGLLPA